LIETEALVIRKYRGPKTDLVVVLATRDAGKVRAVAKGAQRSVRRFGGRLEHFVLLAVQIRDSGRELKMLVDCDTRTVFKRVMGDLALFAWGSFVLETLDVLVAEEAPERETFDHAVATLGALDRGEEPAAAAARFLLGALERAGWAPPFDAERLIGEDAARAVAALARFAERCTGATYNSLKLLGELERC